MKTEEILRSVPKVLLHDHLDGGLRTSTIIELAKEIKYTKLPTSDPKELGEWFHRGANKGNLLEYLQGFEHTIAVMQTKESLTRIAYEMMEDMKKDGVCYVETRFAPVFHTSKGLHYDDVVKLLEVLNKLVSKGNTVVLIEHNLDVIKNSDYIIDIGPEGGTKGGNLIAKGTPEEVANNPKSYTGKYLKKVLRNK